MQQSSPEKKSSPVDQIICSPLIAPAREEAAERLAEWSRAAGRLARVERWLNPAQAQRGLAAAGETARLHLLLGDDGASPCVGAPWRPTPIPLRWWAPLRARGTTVYLYGAGLEGYAQALAELLQRPLYWGPAAEPWRAPLRAFAPLQSAAAARAEAPTGPRGGQLTGAFARWLMPHLEAIGPLARLVVLGAGDGALLEGLEPFVAQLLCVEGSAESFARCQERFVGNPITELRGSLDRLAAPPGEGRFDLALLLDPLGPCSLDQQLCVLRPHLAPTARVLVAAAVAEPPASPSLLARVAPARLRAPEPAEPLRPAPGTPLPRAEALLRQLESRILEGSGAPLALSCGAGSLYGYRSPPGPRLSLEPTRDGALA